MIAVSDDTLSKGNAESLSNTMSKLREETASQRNENGAYPHVVQAWNSKPLKVSTQGGVAQMRAVHLQKDDF